ncbi:MAG: hypothetical protein MJZ64_00150 [Paludibacteraceae bacterium]|nr:hypothetical protein [Paludibacteraceae bacterium]
MTTTDFYSTSSMLDYTEQTEYSGSLPPSNFTVPFQADEINDGQTTYALSSPSPTTPFVPGYKDEEHQLPIGDIVFPLLALALAYVLIRSVKQVLNH